MATVGGNAKAERDFLRGAGSFLLFRLGGRFHFAFPLQGDQAPTCIVHLRQVNGSRQDADFLSHTIDLFHGSLLEGVFFRCGGRAFPQSIKAILMPQLEKMEAIESKRLVARAKESVGLPASVGGMRVLRCRTP